MSDSEQDFNPFVDFAVGGGLWDGKTVTITEAKFTIDRLTYKDGKPVMDERTGQPSVRNVLAVQGIAEGEEKERRETYSIGGCVPTADGEGFLKADGTPGKLHENSEASRFFRELKGAGFPVESLYDAASKRARVSGLKGARVVFVAVPKLDKDGKIKKSKDGKYTENHFFPSKFVGKAEGTVGAGGGNGAAAADALKEKAMGIVMQILAEAGGTLSRSALVSKIGAAMAGDKEVMKVVALVVREDFHKGAPWKHTATEISL
jgi:hypothetical protein